MLLPELVVSIILLLTIDAGLMQETGSIPLLAGLLEHLDRFNHLAPGQERDDNEDLAWPGIMGKTLPVFPVFPVFVFLGAGVVRTRLTEQLYSKSLFLMFLPRRIIFHWPKFKEQRGSISNS